MTERQKKLVENYIRNQVKAVFKEQRLNEVSSYQITQSDFESEVNKLISKLQPDIKLVDFGKIPGKANVLILGKKYRIIVMSYNSQLVNSPDIKAVDPSDPLSLDRKFRKSMTWKDLTRTIKSAIEINKK